MYVMASSLIFLFSMRKYLLKSLEYTPSAHSSSVHHCLSPGLAPGLLSLLLTSYPPSLGCQLQSPSAQF